MTNLEQYAADLHQEVLLKTGDDANPRLREEAFTEVVLELLEEHNEAGGAEISSFEAKGSKQLAAAKLNAWALSGDGATLDLFVTRYHGDGEITEVGKPEVRRFFELVSGFLKRALDASYKKMEESSSVFQAARQIHEARDNLTTVRLFLLTDGVVRAIDLEPEAFPGLDLHHVVWDVEKLSRLRVGERKVIELDFVNDYGGSIPCIQTQDATGEYRTFLAFVRATVLARIYGEHGQRLLERNVRAFLQAKGKINRGLQKTLKEEPHRFLAYNNGLCCTAAAVDVKVDAVGHAHLKSVIDFQIVNGGQTTASIYHALKKEKRDIGQVEVQLKLTVLSKPEHVQEIVPLISLYANSQNKVNTADFSANGPFHHKIEQLSREVWAPAASGMERQTHWYYERARGSYADDRSREGTPAKRRDWEKQNPPKQKFTKTDLAKFEEVWWGLPWLVCLGAEKAFLRHAERMADEGEPAVLDPTYFKHLIAKAILFRTAEQIFSAQKLEGYRAQSVAYAVAWLADRSGRRVDLNRIWEDQHLSPSLCNVLTVVTAAAHTHIEGQPGNASEAAKKETCWTEFKKRSLKVGDAWLEDLAATPFVNPQSDEESLERDWELLRIHFTTDQRSMAELEILTGKEWVAARRTDPVSDYAGCAWKDLRGKGGLGLKKLRGLVEVLAAAADV